MAIVLVMQIFIAHGMIINYVDDLVSEAKSQPKAYWINSSGKIL